MKILKYGWFQTAIWGLITFILFFIVCEPVFAQNSPRINVRIVKFSGRPNPGWFFDNPSDLAKLRKFLKGLPKVSQVEESLAGGFLLRADEAKCRFPAWVRVYKGIIQVRTADGKIQYFQDTKGLDQYLRDEATKRGLGKFLAPKTN